MSLRAGSVSEDSYLGDGVQADWRFRLDAGYTRILGVFTPLEPLS